MKSIAGLGNPGKKYDQTKYNTDFMVLDHYLNKNNLDLDKDKFEGLWTKQKTDGEDVIFLESQTFMSDSGKLIAQVANLSKTVPEDILVIHDDTGTPIGKARIRANGKSGSHSGIKSIMACLGTNNFNRLKIGIRHPRKESVVSWVLSPFNDEQQKLIDAVFNVSENIINDFIKGKNAQYLMNQYDQNGHYRIT